MTALVICDDASEVFVVDHLLFAREALVIYLTNKRAMVVPMGAAQLDEIQREWIADRISSFRFTHTPAIQGYAP